RARFREAGVPPLVAAIGVPLAGVAADFDGDGDVDLMLFHAFPLLYLQTGPMQFTDVTSTRMPGTPMGFVPNLFVSARVGDLNGDGSLDVVVDYNHAGPPMTLLNDGSATFALGSLPGNFAFRDSRNQVELFDADGDGDLDALRSSASAYLPTIHPDEGTVLFLNDGTGAFPTWQRLSIFGSSLVVADLIPGTGPGRDVVMRAYAGDAFQLLFNDGTGHFVPYAAFPSPSTRSRAMACFDVDLDGDDDVVIGGEALVRNRRESALGFRTEVVGMPGNEIGDGELVVEDFDGDGFGDVLMSDGTLLLNDRTGRFGDAGSGRFSDPIDSPSFFRWGVGSPPLAEYVGDVDGNGYVDVLDGTRVVYGLGDGRWSYGDATRLAALQHPQLADLDGDGRSDIVGQGSPVTILMSRGHETFSDESAWRIHPQTVGPLFALGRVDGDDAIDLIVLHGPNAEVLRNDGAGVFDAPRVIGPVASWLVVHDMDADGDGEVISCPHFYVNLGAAGFVDEWAIRMPNSICGGYVGDFLDLEGDGDEDIVWSMPDQTHVLLINDGNGVFQTGAVLPFHRLSASDVDDDGDVDLYAPDRALINDGTGTFVEDPTGRYLVDGRAPLADLDGDGDDDGIAFGRTVANRTRQIEAPYLARRGENYTVCVVSMPGGPVGQRAVGAFLSFGEVRTPLGSIGDWWLEPRTMVALPGGLLGPAETEFEVSFTIPTTVPNGRRFALQGLILDFARGTVRATNKLSEQVY
ncbi:MAG: VCBS repeat-containing protein, partial [Planctomycetes bacterium]|nr:VCBS repeat-containing protein [Planctomycetota bacterium]